MHKSLLLAHKNIFFPEIFFTFFFVCLPNFLLLVFFDFLNLCDVLLIKAFAFVGGRWYMIFPQDFVIYMALRIEIRVEYELKLISKFFDSIDYILSIDLLCVRLIN